VTATEQPADAPVTGSARPFDLVIEHGDLVTMDGQGTVLRDGALGIRDGRIVWRGQARNSTSLAADRRIDARDRILLPGLIDTHFHTGQQLLRGKINQLARTRQLRLPIWRNYLMPFEGSLGEEDVYLSARVAYANLLSSGTTCFAEAGGPHPGQMAQAAYDSGIRGLVAQSTADMGEGLPAALRFSTRDAIERNVALIETWGGSAIEHRVGAWLGLRQLLICTPELWMTFRDLADQYGVRVHTHVAEGTYEVEYAAEQWGMRPAEYLDSIGFLGPRAHAAHSILLSADEIDRYAEHDVSVAHCPLGNFLIGAPRVPEMRRRGIRVGLGTDGAASGSIDLFEAIRVSWVALQSNFGTPWHVRSTLSLEDLLHAATLGGADALGLRADLGSLEVGKCADLIIVNPQRWDLQPVYDPLFTAARGVTGRDVETVIVDGAVVVSGGSLVTLDEDELRAELTARWPVIMERFETAVAA
jgi:5-methylthioadenosine/S-adenosylhomocysteine deaminase